MELHQNHELQVYIDAHIVSVLVLELLLKKLLAVIFFQLKSIVQLVKFIHQVVIHVSKSSCIVHHPPTPLKFVCAARAIEFIVIFFPVAVAENVICHVYVLVIPAVPPERFIEP